MTKLVVPIMVRSLDQALDAASLAARKGADWVEFRIDHFTDSPRSVQRMIERSSLPCIVTCRPDWEGGEYDGDETTRISVLEHAGLGDRAPEYIDFELAAYQRSANIRQKIGLVVDHPGQTRLLTTGLILSSHDFNGRPEDLKQRVDAMERYPGCRAIKVAWKAKSLLDNLDAFEILRARSKPAIALCMGGSGIPSRVLAKKFGGLLTFASLAPDVATAAGQVTIDDLKNRYRWDQLSESTRVYGVIGSPVAHSLSPAIHNAGFGAVGFDGVYLPLEIDPSYEQFKAVVRAWLDAPGLDFYGASVTIPHKANLLRFVREHGGHVEPLAERIGAGNTLTRHDDGTLYASNTDYAGALDAVCDGMGITRDELRGKRVGVLGAGGAARAVVGGFSHHGATVVIYNRTFEKAQKLAEEIGMLPGTDDHKPGKVVAGRIEKLCDSCCEILINCTPIGMHPNVDPTPIPATARTKQWGPGTVVFDTVYNPLETKLLQEARQAGCLTIRGVEMFVRQAGLQFKQWTQHDAPIEMFRKIVTESLA